MIPVLGSHDTSAYFHHHITALIRLPGKRTVSSTLLWLPQGQGEAWAHLASPVPGWGFGRQQILSSTVVKPPPASAADERDEGSIPGQEDPPGVGNGNPLQYSGLKKSKDRAWQVTVDGVAKSQTWLSDGTCTDPQYIQEWRRTQFWNGNVQSNCIKFKMKARFLLFEIPIFISLLTDNNRFYFSTPSY